jgi:hypothetical protein
MKSIESNGPQGDITIQRKRHRVHELGRVGDQSEQRNAQEFLIDARVFQYDINHVNEDF